MKTGKNTADRILGLLVSGPKTAKELAQSLGITRGVYAIPYLYKLRGLRRIHVSGWRQAPRGDVAMLWSLGGADDVPKPGRRPRMPDADKPNEFPRTVYDPARGITRHYSGVQHG